MPSSPVSTTDQSTIVGLDEIDQIASREYSPYNRTLEIFYQALAIKEEGNKYFGQGKIADAIAAYTKGISLFKKPSLNDKDDDSLQVGYDNQSAVDLLAALLGNRSACALRSFDYIKALDDANTSIHFKPRWDKAYARRGEALLGLRLFESALESFQIALNCSTDQFPHIQVQIAKCKMIIAHEAEQRIEVHQLLPGRDICITPSMIFAPINTTIWDRVAIPLRNFIYLIVNKDSREAIVIDACWDVDGILKYATKNKIKIVAAFITHYHTDHIGGKPQKPFDQYPIRVEGIAKLLSKLPNIKAYIHQDDLEECIKANPEMKRDQFISTQTNFELSLPLLPNDSPAWSSRPDFKETKIKVLHTPGHTPGSTCILVNNARLFSGDTLFRGSCGRLDFHDSCKDSMFNSLQVTLAGLDDDIIVYPGHFYGPDWTTIGAERQSGLLFPMDKHRFLHRL